MIKVILLDVDGVLADFHTVVLVAHNGLHLKPKWPAGCWDMLKVLGIDEKQFWAPVDNYEFWRTLQPVQGAVEFYKALKTRGIPVIFSTTPSASADCAKAKIEWLREHFGEDIEYMLGGHKQLMAKPEHLLIDDYDKNYEKFKAAGGSAILFPRVWNANWSVALAYTEPAMYQIVLQMVDAMLTAPAVSILDEAKELTLVARQSTYGHPLDDFTKTALIWTGVLFDLLKPGTIIPPERVPLCMCGVKMSREVNAPKRDNRVDGAGYWNTLEMLTQEKERRRRES
jgi:5'(3')-deoxyribonucleotidase